MANPKADYVAALRYRSLNRFYDLVTRLTTRERLFKNALLAQSGLRPGFRVLDAGCGTGTLTRAAKQLQPEARIVGLDGDRSILDIAVTKQPRRGRDVAYVDGLCYDLPFAAQSFDRVLCSLLLHHLTPEAKTATLAEIRRVLRPGGELHIADWGAATGPVTRTLFKPVQKLDGTANTADHVAGRLPLYLSAAGFSDVRVRRNFHTVFGILSLYSASRIVDPTPRKASRTWS